jgi:hypothetical protein
MPNIEKSATSRHYVSNTGLALAGASAAFLAFCGLIIVLSGRTVELRGPLFISITSLLVVFIILGLVTKRDVFIDKTGGFISERLKVLTYESVRTTGIDEIEAVVVYFRHVGNGGRDPNPRVAMRLKPRSATRSLIPAGAYASNDAARLEAEDLGLFIERPVILPEGF